jgi:hypothetical protein
MKWPDESLKWPDEEVPLWNTVTAPLAHVLEFAFGCRHRRLSRVFTIDNHTYRVCCDCGARFNYSLETMSIRRRRLLSALRRIQMRPSRLLRRAMRAS